ncbi:MAG: ParB N-terminal domain-containing protein [Burkholderiales bacterium]|nr:ParB N-terminal domain-containing protein [Burkholderiales bacterium]
MSGEPTGNGGRCAVVPVATGGTRPRHGSLEERRRLVAESLQVGNPGNRAKDLPEQADPNHDCQIELKIEDVRPYEHNPRRANNAKFAEIKESIRSSGIRTPLTVTRRPGERHFIVEAGGNTRLLALQQLWEETRDPRFAKVTVIFRPWRSEAHVLTAHLIENEQRGEMTFWDKANGIAVLKGQLEQEKGHALSLRQLEEELKAIGFAVNTATLTHYLYATTRLRILGDALPALSGLDVKTIQPRLNLMKRYAQMRGGTGETALYAGVFDPVFLRHADQYRQNQAFDASDLCQACEEALAQHLGENVARLRMVLDALVQSPHASLDALFETVGSALSNVPALRTQALGHAPDGTSGVSSANGPPGQFERRAVPRAAAQMTNVLHTDLAALLRLKESIARFAKLANVAGCVQSWDAGPLGYYMEMLPTPSGEEGQPRLELRAWWLLALVSGQFHPSVRASLPDASRWRRLATKEDADDKETPSLIESDLPAVMQLDAEFFDWLLDGHDEVAVTFWEIVNLARELRSATPQQIEVFEQPNSTPGNG